MVDAIDLLQCPVCKTFYKPATTPTGRLIPHCPGTVKPDASYAMLTEHADLHMNFTVIEDRIVRRLLIEDVVDPPLTGSLLDIEM